jgi:hypothetical protein
MALPRQARRPQIGQRDVARLLAETALLDEAVRDLREIRAACLKALGRTP